MSCSEGNAAEVQYRHEPTSMHEMAEGKMTS